MGQTDFQPTENMSFRLIECDGLHVAGLIETCNTGEHPVYYPSNYLIYVEQGNLRLRIDEEVYVIGENEFVFIRKNTRCVYYKNWSENQDGFREYIFVLHDSLVKEVMQDFDQAPKSMAPLAPVIKFGNAPILEGLMKSIEVYIKGNVEVDRQLIRIKTYEALHALIKLQPQLTHLFSKDSLQVKSDLQAFMELNYTQNLSLGTIASLTGRSLSGFNRDFREIYKQPPHKWLLKKRLNRAKAMMEENDLRASEVYWQVGFEDLAHFSRAFKKEFNVSPSKLYSV